jgi:cyclopropane fatty-acyl-phospholipid synthase-like methyltransferase
LYNHVDKDIYEMKYLNLGYWEKSNNVLDACQSLVDLVAKNAELYNGCSILDVGCGYGIQDVYINQLFPESDIIGINIVSKQLEYANEAIMETKAADRIKYLLEDATLLSFDSKLFDRIISIEAAIHFNTREDFFRKAYNALKSDGIICVSDTTQDIEALASYKEIEYTLQSIGIPRENLVDETEYFHMLSKIGFRNIEFINITEHVVPYASIQLLARDHWRSVEEIQMPSDKKTLKNYISDFRKKFLYHNYFIIKATK